MFCLHGALKRLEPALIVIMVIHRGGRGPIALDGYTILVTTSMYLPTVSDMFTGQ